MIRCPHCRKKLNEGELVEKIDPALISRRAGSIAGKRGGKAQSRELAQKAAAARWNPKLRKKKRRPKNLSKGS
jgi:hypothetical protein